MALPKNLSSFTRDCNANTNPQVQVQVRLHSPLPTAEKEYREAAANVIIDQNLKSVFVNLISTLIDDLQQQSSKGNNNEDNKEGLLILLKADFKALTFFSTENTEQILNLFKSKNSELSKTGALCILFSLRKFTFIV